MPMTASLEALIAACTDRELAETAQHELDCLLEDLQNARRQIDEADEQHEQLASRAADAERARRQAEYDARREREDREAREWERETTVRELERARARGDQYAESRALRRLKEAY